MSNRRLTRNSKATLTQKVGATQRPLDARMLLKKKRIAVEREDQQKRISLTLQELINAWVDGAQERGIKKCRYYSERV